MAETNNDRINKIELRSEEVQEVMGQVPSWILRWGITVIALILVVIVAGCFFFRYSDTLSAPITVTSSIPPVEIYAKVSGKMEKIMLNNRQSVRKNDVIAVIESTAEYGDVEDLQRHFTDWKQGKLRTSELYDYLQKREWVLGDIQPAFVMFNNALHDYTILYNDNYYSNKMYMKATQRQIRQQIQNNREQSEYLHSQQTSVAHNIYTRDSILYAKKVKTGEEYDQSHLNYLQSKQSKISDIDARAQEKMQELQDNEEILDLSHQVKTDKDKILVSLRNAADQFVTSIMNWKKQYVILSPVDGFINTMGNWNSNMSVSNGDLLLIVLPKSASLPIGKAKLPAVGAGKVQIGQSVIVRLNNYPYNEFGHVVGNIHSISAIPDKEGNYYVEISFPSGLKTNYGKQLPLSKQMLGEAKIIVKNKRLIESFIEPLEQIMHDL